MANVRRALRELAHAACYQLENFDLAARALATAADISDGAERAALHREREQLLLEIVRRKAREMAAEHATAAAEAAALAEAVVPTENETPVASEPPVNTKEPAPQQSELPLWTESVPAGAEGNLATPEPVAESAAAGTPLSAFGSNQLHLEVGGHVLDLDPTRLVFNGVNIAPDDITGLRYGVVAAGEEGPAGGRWHRIAWCSAETVVTLDETNLFGPAAPDPARLYNLILETLYGLVVPGLIVRLVDWVRHGETVPLGAAWLRPDGLVFSGRTFHWPTGAAVPYSQLAYALDDGEFVVLRAENEDDTERFALAEVWNAAIAGHVIDALASVTPPTEEQ